MTSDTERLFDLHFEDPSTAYCKVGDKQPHPSFYSRIITRPELDIPVYIVDEAIVGLNTTDWGYKSVNVLEWWWKAHPHYGLPSYGGQGVETIVLKEMTYNPITDQYSEHFERDTKKIKELVEKAGYRVDTYNPNVTAALYQYYSSKNTQRPWNEYSRKSSH